MTSNKTLTWLGHTATHDVHSQHCKPAMSSVNSAKHALKIKTNSLDSAFSRTTITLMMLTGRGELQEDQLSCFAQSEPPARYRIKVCRLVPIYRGLLLK